MKNISKLSQHNHYQCLDGNFQYKIILDEIILDKDFSECRVKHVDFWNSLFQSVSFHASICQFLTFENCNLQAVTFRKADLETNIINYYKQYQIQIEAF